MKRREGLYARPAEFSECRTDLAAFQRSLCVERGFSRDLQLIFFMPMAGMFLP
jgi:hypothetical protein